MIQISPIEYPAAMLVRNQKRAILDPEDPEKTLRIEDYQTEAEYAWRFTHNDGRIFYIAADDDLAIVAPFADDVPTDMGSIVGDYMQVDLKTGGTLYGGEDGHRAVVHEALFNAWQDAGVLVPANERGL